jgi:hypothetical protein
VYFDIQQIFCATSRTDLPNARSTRQTTIPEIARHNSAAAIAEIVTVRRFSFMLVSLSRAGTN